MSTAVDSLHLTDQVLVALRRIMRATDLHSRQLLRRFGITGPQLLVLREIGVRGELSGSALARAISVSLPTATDIAARLETRGLATRRRNASDRRQVMVSLTDEGRRILDAAPPPLQDSLINHLVVLPEWEQTQILSVLQRVVAMMEADELPASPILTTGRVERPPADRPNRIVAADRPRRAAEAAKGSHDTN